MAGLFRLANAPRPKGAGWRGLNHIDAFAQRGDQFLGRFAVTSWI